MSEWSRVEKLDPGRRLINDVFMCLEPAYGFGIFWVDMEKAHQLTQYLKEVSAIPVTYLHLFIRACGLALARYPQVHAMIDGDRRILHPATVDIGVSAAGATNYAPVVLLRSVDQKDLATLARELQEGATKARDEEQEFLRKVGLIGRFLPFRWLRRMLVRFAFRFAKVRRAVAGNFQITCLPEEIIVPFRLTTTALMGIGQVRERPAVVEGRVVPRKSVYIAIPVDHRVVDGKVPMLFAYEVIRLMENPHLLVENTPLHEAGSAALKN